MENNAPVVIIGAGLAGLTAALALAPRPVILVARAAAGEGTSSILAQGGIAVAAGPDDHPDIHADDTLKAGAGLCDEDVVRQITAAGPEALQRLVAWGVPFDRDPMGSMRFSLEGAHSRRRVAHVGGDATGAGITKALAALALRTPSITLVRDAEVARLVLHEGRVAGVVLRDVNGMRLQQASSVVLATGGAGALWAHTTSPNGSWGQGLALAARAGAILRDIEFMQFHPTAIDVGEDPMPLASEALRGEGARLLREDGSFLLENDLSARDIVARAIWGEIAAGRRVTLDGRGIAGFASKFPTIHAFCRKAGINPAVQPIPIRPVAHYHMGGVATNAVGQTSVDGLWACGEVAATGLHGGNRLASNSLLEAVVMGMRVAQALPESRGALPESRGALPETALQIPACLPQESADEISFIRNQMDLELGVLREEKGLSRALRSLRERAAESDRAFVGSMIAEAALQRKESRGAHRRTDYAVADPAQAHSRFWQPDPQTGALVETQDFR